MGMSSLTELFVAESRRLYKAGKLFEAILSLENAMCTRDCSEPYRIIMREILNDMDKEYSRS